MCIYIYNMYTSALYTQYIQLYYLSNSHYVDIIIPQ